MTLISGIAETRMALCRKPPAIRTFPAEPGGLPGPDSECHGEGGAGGPGTIRRGAGAALTGLKTLIHNPRLLWFPLFVALVLAGLSTIRGLTIELFSSLEWQAFTDPAVTWLRFGVDPFLTLLWPDFYSVPARLLASLVLTFAVELVTVFCLVFLVAGLVLCLSSEAGKSFTFFTGLTMAGKYRHALFKWSVIVAAAGTLIFTACQYSCDLNPVLWQFLSDMINRQNPFSYVITPNFYNSILPTGEFGFINSGLADAMILSAINVLLFVLTLFVIPLLVCERTGLKESVIQSFDLMRKSGHEIAACALVLGIVISAALLVSLLFPWAAGGNISVGYWPPPEAWLAAGFLYVLILSIVAVVAATVGGIAARDLYLHARTGWMPGTNEPEPGI